MFHVYLGCRVWGMCSTCTWYVVCERMCSTCTCDVVYERICSTCTWDVVYGKIRRRVQEDVITDTWCVAPCLHIPTVSKTVDYSVTVGRGSIQTWTFP